MNKRMTIFAGAGASKAVDPDQYPTTVEFFDGLPIFVTTNLLFKSVVALLMQDDKNRILDIEIILWKLSELLSFCEQVSNQEEFPAWLFFQDRLAPMLPFNHPLNKTKHIRKGFDVASVNEAVAFLDSTLIVLAQHHDYWSYCLAANIAKPATTNKTTVNNVSTVFTSNHKMK